MNDGNDYNFMTIFNQAAKNVVPRDVALDHLRALLECQSLDIRNLAARALMVYHAPPETPVEASHYQQAMASRDWPVALGSIVKYQSQIEATVTMKDRATSIEQEVRGWLAQTPA